MLTYHETALFVGQQALFMVENLD